MKLQTTYNNTFLEHRDKIFENTQSFVKGGKPRNYNILGGKDIRDIQNDAMGAGGNSISNLLGEIRGGRAKGKGKCSRMNRPRGVKECRPLRKLTSGE